MLHFSHSESKYYLFFYWFIASYYPRNKCLHFEDCKGKYKLKIRKIHFNSASYKKGKASLPPFPYSIYFRIFVIMNFFLSLWDVCKPFKMLNKPLACFTIQKYLSSTWEPSLWHILIMEDTPTSKCLWRAGAYPQLAPCSKL